MVSEHVELKGHLPIHAPSPKSVGCERGVLGKTKVPHRIDETLDESYKEKALLTSQAGFVRMI